MAAHREQGLFTLSPDKVALTLGEAIDDGRVLVAEKDGALIGTFAWTLEKNGRSRLPRSGRSLMLLISSFIGPFYR